MDPPFPTQIVGALMEPVALMAAGDAQVRIQALKDSIKSQQILI